MTLEIIRDKVDLPFIMTTERLEGYEALVGRWDQSRHRKALHDERYAYFLAKADVHAAFYSTFNLQRHLVSRSTLRIFRAEAVAQWSDAVAAA